MNRADFLPYREIHLDFHTSEEIPGIGADFDPDEFADTLVKARVNSITCFARCHHGWIYYDTDLNPERRHPHLTRNLLKEQIEACHAPRHPRADLHDRAVGPLHGAPAPGVDLHRRARSHRRHAALRGRLLPRDERQLALRRGVPQATRARDHGHAAHRRPLLRHRARHPVDRPVHAGSHACGRAGPGQCRTARQVCPRFAQRLQARHERIRLVDQSGREHLLQRRARRARAIAPSSTPTRTGSWRRCPAAAGAICTSRSALAMHARWASTCWA